MAAKANAFDVGDYVVYPKHGVGRVIELQEQEIAGMKLELYVLRFEKERMTLRVPTNKVEAIGMRKLSSDKTLREALDTLTGKPVQAKPISTFPPVKQDLAFTVDETVTAGQLENVIRKAAGANLESIELFDVFTGEQVGEGKKSLAYAVVFRSPSKTLSAEDSDAIRKAIVAEAAEIGAQLRA